jgi:polysaccharide biosynthesis transport protein
MPPVTQAADTAPAFSAGDVARVARARVGLVLGVATLVVLATLGVLMLLPTMYSSSASVMLDPRKNNVADLSSVLSQLPTDPASLQNQIQILQSRDLAEQVIAKLQLYDDPEFTKQVSSDDDQVATKEKIVTAFEKNLTVTAEGLSTTLTVSFVSRDPVKAATIANTLVDTYIADQTDAKREIGDRTTSWLVGRTHDLAAQLQAQEAAVQKYKADNNLTETADGSPLADEQITAISNQLVTAKADLAQKQATDDRVAALIKAGDTADVSQILASPLIVTLRTQQATLIAQESDLTTRYGPRHPKLEAVETQKRDLDAKIATEVTRLTGSISNDVAVARANVASLQGSLSGAEKQAQVQNLVRVKLRALESNADSTRTMYEAFVTRLRETQDQDVIQNPDARVISRAAVPTAPSSPKRTLILGGSIPAGLLLGLLVALIAERLGGAVPETESRTAPRTAPVVRPTEAFRPAPAAHRGPPVLASLNGLSDPRAPGAVLDWPQSDFSRDVEALLRRVLQGGKVFAVTTAERGPAKTATVAALARMAARHRMRVAVIDAGLRAPATAGAFGIGPTRFGLIEALTGAAPLSRAFCRDPRSTCSVLSVAQRPADPLAVLASPKMAGLIAQLRQACDLVIIDAPPAQSARELHAVASLCDGVLAVTRDAGATSDDYTALGIPRLGLVVAR